jgi:tetratricopeptide (TPR) repeat protein
MPPLSENLPISHELTAVPFFPQEEYQCGPAALAMAVSWSGFPARPEDLVEEVYSPARKGSLQMAMIAAARRHGRIAYKISDLDSLIAEIAAGFPIVILQNLSVSWFPVWHYAVVVGYDTSQEHIILRSGTTSRKVMPFGVFEKTWALSNYWGLISYYALGDLTNSEHVFKDTIRLHPRTGSAYNNLAQVLMEQGRCPEAWEMARKAVSLGGPLQAVYRQTLKKIEIEWLNKP